MRMFEEFEGMEDLVRCFREDGYTDDEIEELLILIEDGCSVDDAIQRSME